jgi:diguanylate cyclase (GGDEF)-like protein
VVDDDQTILKLFSVALAQEGYTLLTAASGQEALAKVEDSQVDVVLLDINLPDISGIEVMRRIVKTRSMIIILVTGDDAHYSHDTAVQEGAADFIVKPVRIRELVQRIRQAREMRQLSEAKERLVVELERLAIKDELTGLFNYRHFQSQLKAEVQRCLRYERPLCLVVCDLDYFKSINDTYGHAEGDRVLAGVARALKCSVRGTDTVFRYGGEEFALLLPETHINHALTVAERTRLAVEQGQLLPARPVTISLGLAELRSSEKDEELLRRADAALYAAKRAGRNRVTLA